MFKKLLTIVTASLLAQSLAGNAFALWTADNELYRVVFSSAAGAATTVVNDLGPISSFQGMSNSPIAGTAFSYSTLGDNADATNTYAVYFAKNNKTAGTTTYDVWIASTAPPTSGNRKFAGFNSSVITFVSPYSNSNAPANTTGTLDAYTAKFSALGNGLNFVDTIIEGSQAEFTLASAATLNLYKFSSTQNTLFPVTVGVAEPNIIIATDAVTGVTTINPANTKTTPTITWANPDGITYGTALSGTQLNATSGGVAGTFVYTPPSGTYLNAGTAQTLSVTFFPTDSTNYNQATETTTINVAAADQTITFGAPPNLVSGGATGSVSATASSLLPVTNYSSLTPGVCTISGSTVTPVSAGTCTIAANQAGNNNYNSAPQATQSFSVAQANPAITFKILGDLNNYDTLPALLSGITQNSTIQLRDIYTTTSPETLIFNNGFDIIMNGGLDSNWTPTAGRTTIRGQMIIKSGKLIVSGVAIR